jgi:hypothetical protein
MVARASIVLLIGGTWDGLSGSFMDRVLCETRAVESAASWTVDVSATVHVWDTLFVPSS